LVRPGGKELPLAHLQTFILAGKPCQEETLPYFGPFIIYEERNIL
jgi:hypothetical protein